MRTEYTISGFLVGHDQCERFPGMRDEIPLALYLERNMKYLVHARYRQKH
jgi:hypothetical protein